MVVHSLLDMQIRNGEAILEKYGLKPNDAVLADEKQLAMCVSARLTPQTTRIDTSCAQLR